MHYVVKNITKLKTPQPCHGKNLARVARECFVKHQILTLDFDGVESITPGFFQELLLPMLTEFGADFLKRKLMIINLSPATQAVLHSAFQDLNHYFDTIDKTDDQEIDQEIFDLNMSWLIKARELARQDATHTLLIMGIADDEMRKALSQLSVDDMQTIARSGCLCFAPRFATRFIQRMTTRQHDLVDMVLAVCACV